MTPEEYLVLEDASPYRSEFYDGAMVAMRDRTITNATINANFLVGFGRSFRGTDWQVLGSSMRVLIPALPLYTYPDASVIRLPPHIAPNSETTLIDPVLIMEVLPPSGESYERCASFQHFQTIPTLLHYITVSQERARVDHYWRTTVFDLKRWTYLPYEGADAVLTIDPLGIELPLSEIYGHVQFPTPGTMASRKHPDHDSIF